MKNVPKADSLAMNKKESELTFGVKNMNTIKNIVEEIGHGKKQALEEESDEDSGSDSF